MPSFTALYSRPEDTDGFLEEYKRDHLPIAEGWPGVTSMSTTVFTTTPRGTEPEWFLMFHATWDSQEDLQAAMRDPALMEASKHAMGMLDKYGNRAEMLIGDEA